MTTTLMPPASLLSALIPGGIKKKRVLLLDTSQTKRELRAEVMRKVGMDVDCAADIAEARSRWKADLYDLVLINMEKGLGYRDKFCDDMRSAIPRQRLAFLVGEPKYLADSPMADEGILMQSDGDQVVVSVVPTVSVDHGDVSQRWGILEASKRISEVRSASHARMQAMRALPAPARDLEGRLPKRTPTPTSLDDLLREELQ